MSAQMIITLLTFLFMIVSFSIHKIPMALTSMIGMLILVLTGCVSGSTALANIGSSTTVTMACMFIVAAGLGRTQMLRHVSRAVYRVSKGSFTRSLAGYVLVTFLLGQFVPSTTALFVLVCPLVVAMCEELRVSPSKMLYSIGLTTVAASFTFPVGSAAAYFIEDNGYLAQYGIEGYRFTMFTQMNVKIFVSLFVVVWAIFFAPRFAPDKPILPVTKLTEKKLSEQEPLSPVREFLGYFVFLAVIVCLIFQCFGLPYWVIPAVGAAVLVLGGVLTEREAIAHMNLDVILLYVGVVTLGSAFANTGAGSLLGDAIAGVLGAVGNRYLIGAIFFAAAFLMTSLLYNRAVGKILVPLVLVTSVSLQWDPRGLMVICYIASMCSLVTPMSTSVVPLMMGAGGYDQKSLLRMGLLPSVLMGVVTVVAAMTLYPCF